MKTEIEDIIDCILKWDSENNSYFSTSEYFKVIQRNLKKAIAEQPKTPVEQPREQDKDMIKYILDIDFMTTAEFCKVYNVPEPVFTGEVQSSARLFLEIDAIKHRMFVEKAKELNKQSIKPKPDTSQVEQPKSAEEWFENNFDCYADEMEHDKRGVTMAMTKETFLKYDELNLAVIDKKEVTDEMIEEWADNHWKPIQRRIYKEALILGAKAMRDGRIQL